MPAEEMLDAAVGVLQGEEPGEDLEQREGHPGRDAQDGEHVRADDDLRPLADVEQLRRLGEEGHRCVTSRRASRSVGRDFVFPIHFYSGSGGRGGASGRNLGSALRRTILNYVVFIGC